MLASVVVSSSKVVLGLSRYPAAFINPCKCMQPPTACKLHHHNHYKRKGKRKKKKKKKLKVKGTTVQKKSTNWSLEMLLLEYEYKQRIATIVS